MGPINGINLDRVQYFNLEEYVDKIHLCKNTLYHVEDTSKEFEKYIKFLSNYNDTVILEHLKYSFANEIKYSNKVEKHLINPDDINRNNIYFDSLAMSNNRIKKIHSFTQQSSDNSDYNYRKDEARVSYYDDKGKEHIFWYGAEPQDIKKFMNDYISFYKSKGLQMLDISPFLKASLCHLLFVRIHPFGDGNGRTARLLYDMKFTEMINKLYSTNLKISPLHLSMSIYLNQLSYIQKINDIYFDMEHDCNEEINKFFDFMLNMTDEQIHYMMTDYSKSELERITRFYTIVNPNESILDKDIKKEANGMKIKRLIK